MITPERSKDTSITYALGLPLHTKVERTFYRLACGKYSTTGNNHCRLIAILIVPNRIFANTARTKTTHAIGSRLVDDDLVYTVIEERASISIAALPVTCAVALNLQFLNSTACPLILPSFSASIVHTLYV